MGTPTAFLTSAEKVAFDAGHRKRINFNIGKYLDTVQDGKKQYANLELARKAAKNLKWKAIAGLDSLLLEFERKFTSNGGKVIWARDAKEARTEILRIFKEHSARSVVKSKSMATEELELNEALEANGYHVYETDLGEYIVQLAGEKPYHIVTPAMHKSKEDVSHLFHEKLGTKEGLSPQQLTLVARENLRAHYQSAEIGISGANFILPDIGGISITENEGNARLATTFPPVHVCIVGIEKVIPSVNDLPLFWPLLATHGTGQFVTVYNSIFTGPAKEGEEDGPKHMYVILLDNGRSNLIADIHLRESLYCIRCGACLNVCPVYKNIGGHTYNTAYSGPIGSVITPHLRGMQKFQHLSQASSLCGSCTEICPVRINLHELLLYNRKLAVDKGFTNRSENLGWSFWRRAMLKRRRMNFPGSGIKNWLLRMLFRKSWGKRRAMFEFPVKNFNKLWKARNAN